MPSLETQVWSASWCLSTKMLFPRMTCRGRREQGRHHGGQEAPGQKGALLSQEAGAGQLDELSPGWREDWAAPSESALTRILQRRTPRSREQEGLSQR